MVFSNPNFNLTTTVYHSKTYANDRKPPPHPVAMGICIPGTARDMAAFPPLSVVTSARLSVCRSRMGSVRWDLGSQGPWPLGYARDGPWDLPSPRVGSRSSRQRDLDRLGARVSSDLSFWPRTLLREFICRVPDPSDSTCLSIRARNIKIDKVSYRRKFKLLYYCRPSNPAENVQKYEAFKHKLTNNTSNQDECDNDKL